MMRYSILAGLGSILLALPSQAIEIRGQAVRLDKPQQPLDCSLEVIGSPYMSPESLIALPDVFNVKATLKGFVLESLKAELKLAGTVLDSTGTGLGSSYKLYVGYDSSTDDRLELMVGPEGVSYSWTKIDDLGTQYAIYQCIQMN